MEEITKLCLNNVTKTTNHFKRKCSLNDENKDLVTIFFRNKFNEYSDVFKKKLRRRKHF